MKVSILTLVKGRAKALENMILGLLKNTVLPDELIIVLMNDQKRMIPTSDLKVKQIVLNHPEDLPLAAARNLAVQHAKGDLLIFLDVDCIPSPNLIATYIEHAKAGALMNGQVRYLKGTATQMEGFLNRMDDLSAPDPIRAGLKVLPHELFWSLSFCCFRKDFYQIGGFDETYLGYGGEDTDFAFSARRAGIGMILVPAVAYHQHHDHYSPPLDHFCEIVQNARIFFAKWNHWPMQGWLNTFEDLGLISFSGAKLILIRVPTDVEIAQAKST